MTDTDLKCLVTRARHIVRDLHIDDDDLRLAAFNKVLASLIGEAKAGRMPKINDEIRRSCGPSFQQGSRW
jgi:hypothetical protein